MKRALVTSTILIHALVAAPAQAASEEALLKQMQAMQAQMNRMQQEMSQMRAELEKTKAQAKSAEKVAGKVQEKLPNKPESDVKITMTPAPKFETADGAYSFKVGGFAQVDAGMFSDDRKDHPDGTNIRRARLNVSGVIAKDFKYKLENDFAGNASSLTDAYLEYAGFEPTWIMIGQFKEPFGLETLTSDLFTTFIERSSAFAFSPDRKIGVAVGTSGTTDPIGAWTATLGGFGSGSSSTSSTDDEARDITGRLTWAPFYQGGEILHLGIAGSHRIPDSANDTFSFSSRAENQLSSASSDLTVNTGSITRVDSVDLLGLELAGVYGPFSVQGEYVKASVDRQAGFFSPTYNGYYVEASYFLTGESRNYQAKSGRFDRVKPKWELNPGENAWGAWQIAARYSDLDLSDGSVNGGEMKNTTLGLRWIPRQNIAVSANYIVVNSDALSVTANDDPRILLFRTQFDF